MKIPITVAYGDGIGPEIMQAVLKILRSAKAKIEPEIIEVGEKIYLAGISSGISEKAWESLQRNQVFLKAPITTPMGGGYKSLNVTIRKTFGLYSNLRPCKAFSPYVPTLHPQMDLVVVRENEEDLYASIEYQQTHDVCQGLKLISHTGSEKIIRFAFEYARKFSRKKITCVVKDNIMKMTDGLFHNIFNEVGKEYADIQQNTMITDIATALIATNPQHFDVIVTLNLYGDIISDVTAQTAGSVGLAGSANIGERAAMFEAIHGSAPLLAGKNIANPSGLLNGAILMLLHIGLGSTATLIENAWLKTLEDGIHTADVYRADISKQKVGTQEFAQAVIDRLGQQPENLKSVKYPPTSRFITQFPQITISRAKKELVGVDIYLDAANTKPTELAEQLQKVECKLKIKSLSNRGLIVWPQGIQDIYCSDHWCARFYRQQEHNTIQPTEIITLLQQLQALNLEVIQTENLYLFDNKRGFSLAQGE